MAKVSTLNSQCFKEATDMTESGPKIQLSRLTHLTILREGSHSILYYARNGTEEVVIKMMKATESKHDKVAHEFDVERAVLRKVRHRHIINYIGSGSKPRAFLVMQYANQGTLRDLLAQRVKLQFPVVLSLARQIAMAMNYLHAECLRDLTVIHRDLKPENIGILDEEVKLIDFGLSACVQRRGLLDETYEMSGCTGTLRYMAPEVALSQPYNETVDVYSFGIILWQMASGQVPFASMDKETFMREVVRGHQRPALDRGWSREFQSLLVACWSEHISKRPSFAAILDILHNKL